MEQQQLRKQMVSPEVAMASEVFDQFCNAATLKSILGHFRHLCDLLKIKPTNFNQFYPKLKSKLRSWKAQALWKKFDQRANHKCYNRGKACLNTRVLIIGGGPCGVRSAIEAQLLGAKVVVVEKRDRMSRNNVLHLWPFVIHDLRALGAKKFFGKFCAGSIDHISIRQLQCILLKVALILGVEFHENVSFERLVEPQEGGKIGWRAKTSPADHPVSQYVFDVLVGADGKRNTLDGFRRKEFRGKLAIAITANFINKRTEAEARVEEISGVAFIFNQKFFKELHSETGIDLENIVYYKDDTHYFVMTAKKHSLIDKGVILQDRADTASLLAKENVDREALMQYAREAAEFSTEYQMLDMEFAVNHYGQPDVAMFDFTSMYAAENASRVLEKHGHRLLMTLVGDSLLEPFWPTGSGCARGFLSSLDACWAIKGWGGSRTPLEVIAERESIYRLLGQTTPENLNRDYAAYTLDPHTRYPNLNARSVASAQVASLLDTDDPETFKLVPVQQQASIDLPKKRRRRDSQVHPDTLLHWLQRQVALYEGVRIHDMGASFKSGLAIAAILHRYRPDLIDYHALNKDDAATNNQTAFDVLEKELGIPAVMTGEEMAQCELPDKLAMFSYLTQIYEAFRGEIPHIKHPKLEPETEDRPTLSQKCPNDHSAARSTHRRSRHAINDNISLPSQGKTKEDTLNRRHARKRRSTEKMGATVEERMQRLADIEKNRLERMLRRQQQRKRMTQQFYKSMQMLQANAKRDKDEPFEDYSIFLYRQTAADFKDRVKDLEQKILFPDREPKFHLGHHRGSVDEGFSGRIKNIEEKLKGAAAMEKKPKDLLRAIGKIEKSDWNVKEIEKKIEENKMGRGVRQDKVERVPKWSREQTKMEKKGREPERELAESSKYADIDNTLKSIDRKIKEGNVLGHNKVSAMAEQFASKTTTSQISSNASNNKAADSVASSEATQSKVQRSNSKAAIALPAQGGSEMCHFCEKRVYLMERLTAEGKSFHRGCFRCEYCSTSLRIGNHTFDRDKNGGRFYCTQHFGLPGTMKSRIDRKKLPLTNKENIPQSSNNLKATDKSNNKLTVEGIPGLDLLDRGQTPERIEFENLAGMSDAEEAQSIMDEDEWTDRNFGPSAAEMGSSDDISDMSDSDEDNEVFEEAMDQPLTTEGTLELAKNWTLRYSHPHPAAANSDTGSNEYEDSSDEYTSTEEESGTATEDDEEDVRARELRKQEVWLQVPPRISDTETGSDTEVKLITQHSSVVGDSSVAAAIVESSEPVTRIEITEPDVDLTNPLASLPDAIPHNESETGSQHSSEVAAAFNATDKIVNLPDLVTSSPKLSRNSSRSSVQSFASIVDDEPLTVRIATPDTTWLEVDAVLNKLDDQQPMLMVTAPTPTTERPLEGSPLIEASKLVVPKERSPSREQQEEEKSTSPTSFDTLLQELRQRKAKNKAEAEAREALKPLATETARMKMNKYFDAKRKDDDMSADVVELQVKTRVSDKVEKKHILKYFGAASFDSSGKTSTKSNSPAPEGMLENDDVEEDEILKEYVNQDLEIDEIEREFNKIERQNESNLLEMLEATRDDNAMDDEYMMEDLVETAVPDTMETFDDEVVIDEIYGENIPIDSDSSDDEFNYPLDLIPEITESSVDSEVQSVSEQIDDDLIDECIEYPEMDKIFNELPEKLTNENNDNRKDTELAEPSEDQKAYDRTLERLLNDLLSKRTSTLMNLLPTDGDGVANFDDRVTETVVNPVITKDLEIPVPAEKEVDNIVAPEKIKDAIPNGENLNNNHHKTIDNEKVKQEFNELEALEKLMKPVTSIEIVPLAISEKSVEKSVVSENKSFDVNELVNDRKKPEILETTREPKINVQNPIEQIVTEVMVDPKTIPQPINATSNKLTDLKPHNPPLPNKQMVIPPTKMKIQKIVVQEQQLLPVKITILKPPNRMSAKLETIPPPPAPSDDTPKRPGRRRPETLAIPISVPSPPVEQTHSSSSSIRKTLSARLRKHSGSESPKTPSNASPVPRSKNGLLSRSGSSCKSNDNTNREEGGSEKKEIDSSNRGKKDKCVIS